MANHKRPAHAVTLRDVATQANLSVSTISRALADHPSIPEATRDRVKALARRMHYQPNGQARALKRARTDTIGIVIPSLVNPYFAALAAAIQDTAGAHGLGVIIANADEEPEKLTRAVRTMRNQRVDGMIIVPFIDALSTLSALESAALPVVFVDREIPELDIPSVTSDPRPGIEAAVEFLRARRQQPLGYLAGPQNTSTGQQRLEQFLAVRDQLGIAPGPIAEGSYDAQSGYRGTQQLLDEGAKAILAGDYMMSIGALQALHERGLALGRDVTLVGFDDFQVFRLQNPPVPVIDQNVAELGSRACTLLAQLIAEDSPGATEPQPGAPGAAPPHPTRIRIPTKLMHSAFTAAEAAAATPTPRKGNRNV